MSTLQFIIYGLVDPDTNEIRYIGKSSYGLKRPKEHFKPSNYLKQRNHKAHWIKRLKSEGKEPLIVILKDALSEEQLNQLEIETIKEYREKYGNLTNGTDGGEGSLGWVPTEENKANQSKARYKFLSTLTEPLKAVNKKEHVFVNDIECKICVTCTEAKSISDYSGNKNTWDKLHTKCKSCAKEYTRKFREKNPYKKLSKEELAQSYIDRAEAISEGVQKAYDENDTLRQRISIKRSKPLEATNLITGEKLYFNSALEANNQGFNNTNIHKAMKASRPYRGFTWRFI